MKKLAVPAILFLLAIGLCALPQGCASQQKVVFNTLYSVEHTTVAAYDGYMASVISGATSTNAVPKVSKGFNTFQASFLVALDAAQFNTNAIAPASLVQESSDLINLINTVKGK